jgi:hypothetical protein
LGIFLFLYNNLAYNSTAWFEQKQGLHVTSILDPSLHTPKITKSASRPVQVWCIELNEREKNKLQKGNKLITYSAAFASRMAAAGFFILINTYAEQNKRIPQPS